MIENVCPPIPPGQPLRLQPSTIIAQGDPPDVGSTAGQHIGFMARYWLHHRHEPDECGVVPDRAASKEEKSVDVGTSAGATIALDLAVRRPDLVRAVVVHEAAWADAGLDRPDAVEPGCDRLGSVLAHLVRATPPPMGPVVVLGTNQRFGCNQVRLNLLSARRVRPCWPARGLP